MRHAYFQPGIYYPIYSKNLAGHYWDLGGFKNQQCKEIFGKRAAPSFVHF